MPSTHTELSERVRSQIISLEIDSSGVCIAFIERSDTVREDTRLITFKAVSLPRSAPHLYG